MSVVVDGLLYLPSVRRLPFGGRDITRHLQQRLAARGTTIDEPDVVQVRAVKAFVKLALAGMSPPGGKVHGCTLMCGR